jgi:hypothetical protein
LPAGVAGVGAAAGAGVDAGALAPSVPAALAGVKALQVPVSICSASIDQDGLCFSEASTACPQPPALDGVAGGDCPHPPGLAAV